MLPKDLNRDLPGVGAGSSSVVAALKVEKELERQAKELEKQHMRASVPLPAPSDEQIK